MSGRLCVIATVLLMAAAGNCFAQTAQTGIKPQPFKTEQLKDLLREIDPQLIVVPGSPVGPQVPPHGPRAPTLVLPNLGNDVSVIHLPAPAAASAEIEDAQPAPAPPSYLGQDFRKIETGLSDCKIPFAELKTMSPACTAAGGAKESRRCEQYSPTQFPEVVSIQAPSALGRQQCTGTLIGSEWILTAAHCILGDTPAKDAAVTPGADVTLEGEAVAHIDVLAANSITLNDQAAWRSVSRAVVFGQYQGRGSKPPYYENDLALLRLTEAYPAFAVEPARVATAAEIEAEVTLAGYGYSEADGGTLGLFNVTWPGRVTAQGEELQFSANETTDDGASGFCQGDSGGPAFVGRTRGCPADTGERRPRFIEGVISYNYPGIVVSGESRALRQAKACLAASKMVMQNVTSKERRDWVCAASEGGANGCSP